MQQIVLHPGSAQQTVAGSRSSPGSGRPRCPALHPAFARAGACSGM
ncbi:hypothetical protein [Streptomyces uncialis]